MTKEEFLNVIEEVAEIEEGTLTGDESLSDLDTWDSLAVVSFIAMIDEKLEITLSPEKISQAKTVKDLMAMLGGNIQN